MNYQLITTTEQLNKICASASLQPQIALDTEFVRTRTYYPKLGLIQLYDGHNVGLIDPLQIDDWRAFIELLLNENIIKYIHAGSEDAEVFLRLFDQLPSSLIDTQVMAGFMGQQLSWGFAAMVKHYTGIELDKTESRTDWLARPLSRRQCHYAAADVYYLLPIARQLHLEAEQAGKLSLIIDECQMLAQRRQKIVAPEDAWLNIKNVSLLRPRQLAILQWLAAWRLNYARLHDIAVNFVVKEETLWKIARFQPTSLAELRHLGLFATEIRLHGRTLIEGVSTVMQLPESTLPTPPINLADWPGYKQVFARLKQKINEISQQSGYSPELLASRRQLNQLLTWHWQLSVNSTIPEILTGWRGELFSEQLVAVLKSS